MSVWKVWLPSPDAGTPSRRSVTLAIVLLVLGVSAAVIAVFHGRLRRIELSRSGLTVVVTVQCREPKQLVAQLPSLLDGVAMRSVAMREATLEDAYVALVSA